VPDPPRGGVRDAPARRPLLADHRRDRDYVVGLEGAKACRRPCKRPKRSPRTTLTGPPFARVDGAKSGRAPLRPSHGSRSRGGDGSVAS
jgi:hypothetical protein